MAYGGKEQSKRYVQSQTLLSSQTLALRLREKGKETMNGWMTMGNYWTKLIKSLMSDTSGVDDYSYLSRYADHAMHFSSHTKRQWFDHCAMEFKRREVR